MSSFISTVHCRSCTAFIFFFKYLKNERRLSDASTMKIQLSLEIRTSFIFKTTFPQTMLLHSYKNNMFLILELNSTNNVSVISLNCSCLFTYSSIANLIYDELFHVKSTLTTKTNNEKTKRKIIKQIRDHLLSMEARVQIDVYSW